MGDSTGLVIDRALLDLLGLDSDDEVQLRIEKDKLIVERADEVAPRFGEPTNYTSTGMRPAAAATSIADALRAALAGRGLQQRRPGDPVLRVVALLVRRYEVPRSVLVAHATLRVMERGFIARNR